MSALRDGLNRIHEELTDESMEREPAMRAALDIIREIARDTAAAAAARDARIRAEAMEEVWNQVMRIAARGHISADVWTTLSAARSAAIAQPPAEGA